MTSRQVHRTRVDAAGLREWLDTRSPLRVLDVRTPAEFESVHIPGSYNLPLETLREHREEIARHLDEDVVLVCRSGARAEQAERALAEIGLANVHVLDGGILGWQRTGSPVDTGHSRWDIERQVRFVAGVLVLIGVLGSLLAPPLLWLAAFVGAGLTVASLTNTCAMGMLLAKLPFNRGASCDLDQVLSQLTSGSPRQSAP
ncbi:MAG: rhodanese-like domain-containing protein [Gemmatimonadota bacterium]